nr:adenosylcobinamide-GDP ribazoletransferase [Lachnospiraceae bacterium]
IAVIQYAVYILLTRIGAGDIMKAAAAVCIPVLITGGIHLDGYMDMSDALYSYKAPEERLKILKDPHIGAFAVISVITLVLICFGAVHEIIVSAGRDGMTVLCFSYVLSRIGSAMTVVTCRPAKKDGSLYTFAGNSEKKTVILVLVFWLMISGAGSIVLAGVPGMVMLLFTALIYIMGVRTSYKALGGLTGDAAGWMLCRSECISALAAAVAIHIVK